jgi:hypothetical protein
MVFLPGENICGTNYFPVGFDASHLVLEDNSVQPSLFAPSILEFQWIFSSCNRIHGKKCLVEDVDDRRRRR